MNNFIRVSNDEIINVSSIHSIKRQQVSSADYEEWINEYNELMQAVIKEYMTNNLDNLDTEQSEEEIANNLPRQYLLPGLVGDCCQRIGFDGIKYYGSKEYDNYVSWSDGYFADAGMCS